MSVKLTFNSQIRSNCNALKAEVAHDSGNAKKPSMGTEALRLCKQGRLKEALSTMQSIRADSNTYVSILMQCIKKKAPAEGKLVETHMRNVGFEPDIFVATILVRLYAKYGNLADARRVFDKMPVKNVVSWTAMIAACAKRGYPADALKFYHEMQQTDVVPDHYIFASVLPACAELETLKRVHEDIIRANAECNVFVGTGLVDMYAKCGRIEDARVVFDRMPERNVVTWTVMIAGYAQSGSVEEAMRLFEKMPSRDLAVCNIMIEVYMQNGCIDQAVKLFGEMPERDVISWTTMIVGHGQNGQIDKAVELFEKIPRRDVVSWSAMIAGYVQNGYFEEAMELFGQMQKTGVRPNVVTFSGILPSYANLAVLQQGKEVHEDIIRRGYHVDVFVGSGLVDMYSKCGSIEEGFQVFDGMPERDVVAWTAMVAGYVKCGRLDDARHVFDKMPERNIVSWNAMVAGYAQSSRGREAIEIFRQMLPVYNNLDHITFGSILSACASVMDLELGRQIHAYVFRTRFESNVFIGNAILDMYCKCGSLEKARQWFFKMVKRDKVSWNAMISGYSQHGQDMKALEMFSQMQLEGMKPTHFTYSSILSACASLAALEYGKQVHACIMNVGLESNVFIGSALVDMYSKCGNVNFARRVFDEMVEQDVVLWNAIIAGYAQNGSSEEALELFEHMLQAGKRPDYITFIAVLNGCIKEGLVHAGCRYFESMDRDHYITPRVEHYACMINLLGSTGHMDEVEKFINNMPFEPNAIMWKSLLNACRNHGNIELAKRAAGCLLELEPENHDTYVMLANVYTFVGRLNEAAEVIKMMNQRT